MKFDRMRFAAVALLSFALFAYCNGDDDNSARMMAQAGICQKETNVKQELVEKLFKNDEFAEDDSLKCFIKCMYINGGFMSENGSFNADELKKGSQKPDLVNKCKDIKGKDICDTAFQVAKCMHA